MKTISYIFVGLALSVFILYLNSEGTMIPITSNEVVEAMIPFSVSNEGYVQVEVEMNNSDLIVTGNCRQISMTVSEHQALSIFTGLNKEFYIRPLTHDIMMDIITNFNLDLKGARIDSFTNDIYNAKIYVENDKKILELDARPTDAVGLAVRADIPVYFNEELLELNGEKIC
jgi:uncharacterized protein